MTTSRSVRYVDLHVNVVADDAGGGCCPQPEIPLSPGECSVWNKAVATRALEAVQGAAVRDGGQPRRGPRQEVSSRALRNRRSRLVGAVSGKVYTSEILISILFSPSADISGDEEGLNAVGSNPW